MKIAVAQIPGYDRIEESIAQHIAIIEEAGKYGAKMLVFPEMSITGYTREQAADRKFVLNDARLLPLKQAATSADTVIIAGAPIQIGDALYIGSFVLYPNGKAEIYTKQYLHEGEEEYFSASSKFNPLILLGDEKIALSICYDLEVETHFLDACQRGCTLYACSIFYGINGIEGAHKRLSRYAKEAGIRVVMSNYCGVLWDFQSGGKSACWNSKGELTGSIRANASNFLKL